LFKWTWLAIAAWVIGGATIVSAQAPRKADFTIKRIESPRFDRPPVLSGSGGGRGSGETGQMHWGILECEFDSVPEWADEVEVKWYVVLSGPRSKTMATGTDTYIYVKKGRRHVAAMFIHPFVLERWTGGTGAGAIEDIGVEIWHQGRLVSFTSMKTQAKTQWWQQFTPQPGLLMRASESPWFQNGYTHYEWSKFTTSKTTP
jgi:hypothetical protein